MNRPRPASPRLGPPAEGPQQHDALQVDESQHPEDEDPGDPSELASQLEARPTDPKIFLIGFRQPGSCFFLVGFCLFMFFLFSGKRHVSFGFGKAGTKQEAGVGLKDASRSQDLVATNRVRHVQSCKVLTYTYEINLDAFCAVVYLGKWQCYGFQGNH